MNRRAFAPLVLAVIFTAGTLFAASNDWQIDPNHTTIGFTVRHMGISNVHGRFQKVSGTAVIDDSDITKSSVNATMEVASVDTGVNMRDNDLRSANYFDAQQYPTITFKSTSVSKSDSGLKITGDLTIHGVTKQVTLDVDGPSAPVKMGPNMRRGLSATTTINRKDFGVGAKTPSAAVGEQIKIQLDVEVTQKAE
ncbi:MAG TPA: YceI family protein [Terriglobales bacterium]|nr:YceI family protein [Terriglobales bacterium]